MNAPYPRLRLYPRNSAEAAARIVALALIANGSIKAVETAALDALQAHERLGLNQPQWYGVIHDLGADLLGPARCGDEGCIPSELLNRMLDEVDDDTQRRLVLRLCSAVVHADCQIDDGESFVLHWSDRMAVSVQSIRQLKLAMSRRNIAQLLGVAQETVSRAFASLAARGGVAVNGRTVDILDATALLDAAHSPIALQPPANCGAEASWLHRVPALS